MMILTRRRACGPRMLAVLVFVGLAGISGDPSAQPRRSLEPPLSGEFEGHVRAVQGDTLDARLDDRRVGIEIIGIKAPRGNTPCGKEATAFLQALVDDGASVEAESGIAHKKYVGMYHVRTRDGRSIAEEMVAAGFARATGKGKKNRELADLEAQAKAAGRGCVWEGAGAP
jgi:endonuclease YncB( thermonuclease family)